MNNIRENMIYTLNAGTKCLWCIIYFKQKQCKCYKHVAAVSFLRLLMHIHCVSKNWTPRAGWHNFIKIGPL